MSTYSKSKVAMHSNCRFCSFFIGSKKERQVDTPWLENDDFAALVSIGSFVEGWSLVCPKDHKVNLADEYSSEKFWRFVFSAAQLVKENFGDIVIFEHGAQSDISETACGTVHAHLHLVPLNFKLSNILLKEGGLHWQHCDARNVHNLVAGREYLFFSDLYEKESPTGFLTILEEGTSQYFRKEIASELGFSNCYNYKDYPFFDKTAKSFDVLKEAALRKKSEIFLLESCND